MPLVIDWLFDIISTTLDSTMVDQENEYMKNMIEYLKLNKEAQTLKDEEWDKFKNS